MLIFSLFAVALASAAAPSFECVVLNQFDDATFAQLLSDIDAAVFDDDRITTIEGFVAAQTQQNTNGFNATQTGLVLSAFPFTGSLLQVAKTIRPLVLDLTSAEAAFVLQQVPFPRDRLAALSLIVDLVVDLRTANQTILALFPAWGDETQAVAIIESAQPDSCVFGDVTVIGRNVVFLIDTSTEMDELLTNGIMTKAELVRKQLLAALRGQFGPGQTFGAVAFNDTVSFFAPQMMSVDNSSIALFEMWLDSLEPSGKSTGFQRAFVAGEQLLPNKGSSGLSVIVGSDVPWSNTLQKSFVAGAAAWAKATGGRVGAALVHKPSFFGSLQIGALLSNVAQVTSGYFRDVLL